jgi:hypothetical protein
LAVGPILKETGLIFLFVTNLRSCKNENEHSTILKKSLDKVEWNSYFFTVQ